MTKFIKYNNKKVHFSDSGKGRPIVLIHGFLMNMNAWDALKLDLVKSYRVILIDLPGHGKSEGLGTIHSMEIMAEVLKSILDYLKIDRLTLIGHSMGGYVALAFAELYGQRLEGLCLVNSSTVADSEEKRKIRDRAIRLVRQNQNSFVRLFITNLFRPKNRRIYSDTINNIKKEALQMSQRNIIAAIEGMKMRANREEIFRNLAIKKLMIIGKKDPVLNYETLIKQVEHSDIECIEFPDGHMSYIENKKEFTYYILHFIEKL